MRWVGIIILTLAVIGLIFGILAMLTPTPGFSHLAIIFLAIGIALGGYTLFGLLTALGKMLPPG